MPGKTSSINSANQFTRICAEVNSGRGADLLHALLRWASAGGSHEARSGSEDGSGDWQYTALLQHRVSVLYTFAGLNHHALFYCATDARASVASRTARRHSRATPAPTSSCSPTWARSRSPSPSQSITSFQRRMLTPGIEVPRIGVAARLSSLPPPPRSPRPPCASRRQFLHKLARSVTTMFVLAVVHIVFELGCDCWSFD